MPILGPYLKQRAWKPIEASALEGQGLREHACSQGVALSKGACTTVPGMRSSMKLDMTIWDTPASCLSDWLWPVSGSNSTTLRSSNILTTALTVARLVLPGAVSASLRNIQSCSAKSVMGLPEGLLPWLPGQCTHVNTVHQGALILRPT